MVILVIFCKFLSICDREFLFSEGLGNSFPTRSLPLPVVINFLLPPEKIFSEKLKKAQRHIPCNVSSQHQKLLDITQVWLILCPDS